LTVPKGDQPASTSNTTSSQTASNATLSGETQSPSSSTAASGLGDLSSFITIEQDMLNLVNNNDLSGAKTRANDLESAWDQAQDTLQPKDQTKWTQIDGTIDTVLSALRASKPNQASCISALEASISAMQSK